MLSHYRPRARSRLLIPAVLVLALAMLMSGFANVAAQTKERSTSAEVPASARVIPGSPMEITVLDSTQIGIRYTDHALGLANSPQFFDDFAEGLFMWVEHHGAKVFGPAYVPGGHNVNPYMPVSNNMAGSGTPIDPWVVTTVNDVPGTKLRLTQFVTYVNGAEFVKLDFKVEQIEGTMPEKVALFHAADIEAQGDISYGYYNAMTEGVGGYYFTVKDVKVYQQFVPSVPPASHQEGTFQAIWDAIGSTLGPGPGFDNICHVDEPLDAGIGMQWVFIVPAHEAVTLGDTMFFSPHTNLAGSFSDVPYGSFFYDSVYYLGTEGIASGYGDTTFRPMNYTTRGQLTKMVVLAEGWELYTPPTPTFIDVPASNPFYPYIETAVQHRVITGYDDNTFRWANNVSRAQLSKIIVLAEGWDIDTTGGPHFIDVPTTDYFYQYIETAYHNGIVGGYNDGTFRPGDRKSVV